MKMKIAILGSTGSIGKNTIEILKKDKNNSEIVLLTTNQNIKELLKQIKEFHPQNIIVYDVESFTKIKKILERDKINIFNNYEMFNKFFKKKIDYTMSAISGLDGLKSTLKIIRLSKKIAIANKESIICAWNLIEKELKKYQTIFIPVDSEHFSIWSLLGGKKNNLIDEVVITASGGPFLNLPLNKFKYVKKNLALKHPNWSMGAKISIDSSTLMNKVFEVIEAQRIFKIDLDKFTVYTHPKSYVHAIVKFKNGLTKVLLHDTDMKIPIFNSIYNDQINTIKSKKLNLDTLNNLDFRKVDSKKFPLIQLIKSLSNKVSLFETILVSANDELVSLFLNDKINYIKISQYLLQISKIKEFQKYKQITPRNMTQIYKLNRYVRLKTQSICL